MFKIILSCLILMCSVFMSTNAYSADGWVTNAKIIKTEFYGNQFTVYFDKTHSATECGHNASVAMDSSTSPGKAHMALMLTAWSSGKSVSVNITDAICYGDRPTIKNFNAY